MQKYTIINYGPEPYKAAYNMETEMKNIRDGKFRIEKL